VPVEPNPNIGFARVDIGKVVTTLSGIQNITTIDQLNAQKANLIQAVTDLRTHVTDQDSQISDLSQKLSANQVALVGLQTNNDSLQQKVVTQQATIDQLNAKLAAVAAAPPPASPTSLADSFRKVVDQIQSQARLQSASGPATTIKSLDIEVKGLVNVQPDGSTVMVLPTLSSQIDATQLSTLRVSFAAIPGTGSPVAPVVSAVSPNSGPAAGGTQVKIAGSGFTGTGAVIFGGSPAASFQVVSDTQVNAVSPSGAGTVDVVVITAAGGASSTSATDHFTYIPAPTVTNINPTGGPAAGGTPVTITGTGFTGATAVTFGTAAGLGIKVASDTQIVVLSPAGTSGSVDIVVTAPGGTSSTSPADVFTYNPPPPSVTAIDPKQGPLAGGTAVTVVGTNFIGVTAVTFGKTGAAKVSVTSDNQLTAVSPKAAAAGVVDVIVTTPSGNSPTVPADQFTYVALLNEPPRANVETKSTPKRKAGRNRGK
jgi:replicative DNA helicase